MALKNFLALSDDKLQAAYEKKAPDANKLRAALIKTLDTALNQFSATEPTRGRKAFSVQNSVVRFTPKAGTVPVAIGGKTEHLIPSERFLDALKELKDAAEKGELDEALTAAQEAPEASDKPRTGRRGPRGPRSAESIEKGRQTRAANKAAKEAAAKA